MSEEHDRHGESAAPHGEWAQGEPENEDSRLDLDSMDEDALRELLRDSVRDIEPSPDALDHLRRAVPARRARRRQVGVGAAAALLVCSVAVPAMLHADFGPIGDKPMYNAGHAQENVAEGRQPAGGDPGEGPAGGDGQDAGPYGGDDQGAESGAPTVGGSAGPDPSSSLGPLSPTCTRDQLSGKPWVGEADAQGRVYGAFTVVNTSENSCTVEGDGVVLATAQGGAQSTMIQVVDHTSGDEATGLPDPMMTSSDEIVLEPDAAYVVRFAWIPRDGGGATGCATSSPTPGGDEGGEGTEASGGTQPMGSSDSLDDGSGSGSGSASGGTGAESGAGTDAGSGGEGSASGGTGGGDSGADTGGETGSTGGDGGTTSPSSVLVTHTPDVGDPVAGQAVIEGACAGTLYRTGLLPAA